MADTGTGWERAKRTVFNEIVESYDQIRPDYPSELFEDILAYTGLTKGKKAVEIGAGTGKATAPFLSMGYDVTAVEISSNMVEFLLKRFKAYKDFRVLNSSFEDTSFEEGRYDLLYAASAFHWVDAEVGCPKAYKLLKENGVAALFRYNGLPADGEDLYDEIQTIYDKHYYSYYTAGKRPIKKSREDFLKPSEIYISYRFENLKDYGFKDIEMKFYEGSKTFCADEYIVYLDTMSDHKSLPEANRQALYWGIKEAILRHGDCHRVNYLFQLYMGRK